MQLNLDILFFSECNNVRVCGLGRTCPLSVFGCWVSRSWKQTKTVKRQNDSAFSSWCPHESLNAGSHTACSKLSQLSAPPVEKHYVTLTFTAFKLWYTFNRKVRDQMQWSCSTTLKDGGNSPSCSWTLQQMFGLSSCRGLTLKVTFWP